MFAATAAAGFFPVFGFAECCEAALTLGEECLAASFLGADLPALATVFFALGLAAGFLVAAAFGSSFFSVNSNAGFGIE